MAKTTKLSPPSPGAHPQPPLHELDSEAFERFCLDITCGETKGIETADLYEPSGAKQYGADYYLDCGDAGLIIGSCKAHERPGKKAILTEAVGEFVKHWESFWKPQNVVKFIICLAGDARSTTRKKHIDEAKKRIRALGIECEVWAKRELLSRCAPLPHVVRRSLGSQWLPYLCEILLPYANDQSLPLFESLALENEVLHSAQTPIINDKLDALQDLLHAGDIDRAVSEAAEIKNTAAQWRAAEPKQKAQILRTIAVKYVPEDIEKAATLYDEAAALHPHSDRYFSALVSLHRESRASALAVIDEPRTARERSFKAALLIEAGMPQDAIDLIGDPDDGSDDLAELARMKSIGFMITKQTDEAIEAAEIVIKSKPRMRAARIVHAIACYAASLSPAARPPGPLWPEPLPSALVKSTKDARRMRRKALQLFEALDRDTPNRELRKPLQVWRLACLIEEPDEREPSAALIDHALADDLFHPGLVLWGLSRKLVFDRTKARRALRNAIKLDDPESISALLAIHADERKFKAGRALLEEHRKTLKRIDDNAPEMWDREFSARQGKLKQSKETDTLIGFGSAPDDATLESTLLDGGSPAYRRFEAALLLAEHDQWQPIRQSADFLMKVVATSEAFRLCAYAVSNVDTPADALAFLDEHSATFFEEGLPWDLARVRIELLAASGDMAAALEAAEHTLVDPSRPEFIIRAELEAQARDIRTAGRFIAQAAAAENVGLKSADRKLHWANILKSEDPKTAAALLSAARFACQHKAVLEKQVGNGSIPEHQAALGQFLVATRVVRTLVADVSIDGSRAAQLCCAACHLYRADWRDGVHGAELEEAAANLLVTWHASILTACLELPVLANKKGRQRVRLFLDALYSTITETATEALPTLLTEIHRRIAVALTHGVENAEDKDVDFIRALTGRYIDAMPPALREGIFQHEPLRKIFSVSASVSAGTVSFDEYTFWEVVERVSSGETNVRAASTTGETTDFSLDPLGIVLSTPSGEAVRIVFPVPGVFSLESEKRIEAFTSFLDEAGFPSHDRGDLMKEFKGANTARDRDIVVQSLLTETIPGKLWPLLRLEQGAQISVDDIAPPSVSALMDWLGFDSQGENVTPDTAFSNLSDRYDELEACKRWCGVPRRFPSRAIEWLVQKSLKNARSEAKELAEYASHPIAIRNVYNLLSARDDLKLETDNLRKRILDSDYADYGGQLLLARGAIQRIVRLHDGNPDPTARFCCAWAWVDRLRINMLRTGAKANAIAEWFAEVSKPGRAGLVNLSRLDDSMNPMTTKTEQIVCGVFDGLSANEIAKLSANQKEVLRAALSNDLTGAVPSDSLLAAEMSDNSSASWLAGPRQWLASLFDIDNDFLRDALTDPVALRQRVLDHPLPEPIALAAVGVGGMSDKDAIRFIRKVKPAIARSDSNDLALFATLVGGLRLKDQTAVSQRRALFRRVARRKIELADAGENDRKGAALLVEAAVTAVINEETDWVVPVETTVREFATVYSPRYARPVADILTLLGECAAMRDRALLF